MSNSSVLSVRLPTAVKEQLDRLAEGTSRSKSYLAAEAIEAFVERELAIIEGIQEGLADAAAGRVVPHETVMADLERIIAEAEAARR